MDLLTFLKFETMVIVYLLMNKLASLASEYVASENKATKNLVP